MLAPRAFASVEWGRAAEEAAMPAACLGHGKGSPKLSHEECHPSFHGGKWVAAVTFVSLRWARRRATTSLSQRQARHYRLGPDCCPGWQEVQRLQPPPPWQQLHRSRACMVARRLQTCHFRCRMLDHHLRCSGTQAIVINGAGGHGRITWVVDWLTLVRCLL